MTGCVPMSLAAIVKRMRKGADQNTAIQEVFDDLTTICRAHFDVFFRESPACKKVLFDEAEAILVGAKSTSDPRYRDHRYTYVDDSGKLATVGFIVNSVLTFFVRTRDDVGEKGFLVSDANVTACVKCRNSTEQGTRAEAIAVSQISLHGLPMLNHAIPEVVEHFHTVEDVRLSTSARVAHYVPIANNYTHVDSVVRVLEFNRNGDVKTAQVYAIQYTIQPVASHIHSLEFFDKDHTFWVSDISAQTPIHWHFVWVLTNEERTRQLKKAGKQPIRMRKAQTSLAAHAVSNSRGAVQFKEWFYSFQDIHHKLQL